MKSVFVFVGFFLQQMLPIDCGVILEVLMFVVHFVLLINEEI